MSSTADDTPIRTDPGLCRDCQHARQMESDRGSIFMLCKLFVPGFALRKVSRACRYGLPGPSSALAALPAVPIDPIIDIRHESAAATVVPTRDFAGHFPVTASII